MNLSLTFTHHNITINQRSAACPAVAAVSQYWCEVKEDKTPRALKAPLDRPILLLMGCQKLQPHTHTRHASPVTKTSPSSIYSWLNRFPDLHWLGLNARSLVPLEGGYLPTGITLRQLAERLEAVVLVRPADRGMSMPAPLQLTGLLFSATGSPPHLLSVGLERRGHDLRAWNLNSS